MSFTTDVTTDIGKVRLLIPDRYSTAPIFQDDEVSALLTLENNNLKRSAALGIEIIATDQAMIQKVIKTLDLSTDGAKLSDALLKRAGLLRESASFNEAELGLLFDTAEWVVDDFTERERYIKEVMRNLTS